MLLALVSLPLLAACSTANAAAETNSVQGVVLPSYQPAASLVTADEEIATDANPDETMSLTQAQTSDKTERLVVAQQAAPIAQSGALNFSGDVLARDKAPIAVEVLGQVLKLNVEVGDRVQAGDVLLQIDSTTLEAQRAQALAGLKAAQAQVDLLLEGANSSDIAAANAALAAAGAAYNRAAQGPTAEDLAIAESQVRQAEAFVKQAQSAYNQVKWMPEIGAMPQSAQLEQATLQYEAAKAQFEKIAQGSTQDVISGASAQVAAARAQLANLQRGAKAPQIAAAEAQVEQAETGLYLTQLQVNKATVRAPIDGIVAQVNTVAGANVAPGAPVFELLSNEVKIVINVDEFSLGQIQVGQPATIRVNTYPDRTFAGEISLIAPQLNAATRTAEVTIRPTADATELSPGMFANVTLEQ